MERQITRNSKLQYLNHLVINITQTNFLYWQNVHIWRLIKVKLWEKFVVRSSAHIKYTLMQIWKLPNIFVSIQKQYPEGFAFLFPRTFNLFSRDICKFLKK